MFLQLLFIVTAQKRMESWEKKKKTLSHIIFPLTGLLLSSALSLKVNRLDSPHSRPNFTEPFAPRL